MKELVYQHRRRFKGKANEVFERGDLEVQEFFESQKAKDTAIKEKREVNKIINGEQQNQELVGDKDMAKPDGTFRLKLSNYNNLAPWNSDGWKIQKEKRLLDRGRIDISCGTEVGCDFRHVSESKQLEKLFQSTETLKITNAYNMHDNVTRSQAGGVTTMTFGHAADAVTDTGYDPWKLGRWSWQLLKGKENHRTRIITAYQPVSQSSEEKLKAVYNQHRRHFGSKGIKGCPRDLFRKQLISEMKKWRKDGERLILAMDANDDIDTGKISSALWGNGLRMKEQMTKRVGHRLPATFARGSKPIDGVWTTPDIDIVAARLMPISYGVGDHRCFILDISQQSIIGEQKLKVSRPNARKLQCNLPGCVKNYTITLEDEFSRRRVKERLDKLFGTEFPPSQEDARRINTLDKDITDSMRVAEKLCRKFKHDNIDFSPKIQLWRRRISVYWKLMRWHLGKAKNLQNIWRQAERAGIKKPKEINMQEAINGYNTCQAEYERLKPLAPMYRSKFLSERLNAARESGNKTTEKQIWRIITREAVKKKWRGIHHATKKKAANSVSRVQVSTAEGVSDHEGEEAVEEAIMSENQQRFRLAKSSPLSSGRLYEDLGYIADTEAAQKILDGTYVPPPGTDEHTINLLFEIAEVAKHIRQGSVSLEITVEDFIYYWKRVKEKTSSSFSGRHFGHYRAATSHQGISNVHAMMTQLAAQSGTHFQRWGVGLSVMLEKIAGVVLVNKLRAILLMEGDFNFMNKLVFGSRMMKMALNSGLCPEETFSCKNKTSEEAVLAKNLNYDLMRQLRHNGAMASVDATNCYDRVQHSFMALAFLAFGVPRSAIHTMLLAIQFMTFHLRTAYGDSDRTYGGSENDRYMGLCQGNGASPAGWFIVSVLLIEQQRRQGHVVTFDSPISKSIATMTALLFVDDTDIPCLGDTLDASPIDVTSKIQKSVRNWEGNLIVTGGALKPSKCFWYLIGFRFRDGQWEYDEASIRIERLYVTNEAGAREGIEPQPLATSKEILGMWNNPKGTGTKQLDIIREKCDEWAGFVTNGYLPRQSVWTAFWVQLWPALKYGIGTNAFHQHEMDLLLHPYIYKILPRMGCNRKIKKEWRTIPYEFLGVGLPNYSLEQLIAQTNLLLQHFSSGTLVGNLMKNTYEQLQLEIGLGGCAFGQNWKHYQGLATDGWMKSIWEGAAEHKVNITIDSKYSLKKQREGDSYLMELFFRQGYRKTALNRLNRVRKYYRVYSLADIRDVSGADVLDRFTDDEIQPERCQSTMTWPREEPSRDDFTLWRKALMEMEGMPEASHRLGKWIETPHIEQKWHFSPTDDTLWKRQGGAYHGFRESERNQRTRNNHTFTERMAVQTNLPQDAIAATVEEGTNGPTLKSLLRQEHQRVPEVRAATVREQLERWGQMWVWDHVQAPEGFEDIAQAIKRGEVRMVGDGSYMPNLTGELDAAGWIIECKRTRRRIWGSLHSTGVESGSYRGELLSLYALHAIVLAMSIVFDFEPEIGNQIFCDNESALEMARDSTLRLRQNIGHSDIIRAIRVIKNQQKGDPPEYKHVYGHQEEKTAYRKLAREAQLNCYVDEKAKDHLKQAYLAASEGGARLPHEEVWVRVNGVKVTGEAGMVLRYECGRNRAKEFYQRHKIMSQGFDDVAWAPLKCVLKGKAPQYRLWLTKTTSKCCGSKQMLHRWGYEEDPLCPLCKEHPENSKHQLQCKHVGRNDLYQEEVTALINTLETMDTCPDLLESLETYLTRKGEVTFADTTTLKPHLEAIGRAQDRIAWLHFMEGKISHEMISHQALYYLDEGSIRTADSWAKQLITRLLQITHGPWIYRNVMVHGKKEDVLSTKEREEPQ